MAREETSSTAAAATARLRKWAISPTGGGKIFKWGEEDDFQRCQLFYKDKMPSHMIDGWCSNLHLLATGSRPGHALSEGGDGKANN